jgi:hypothetical protein
MRTPSCDASRSAAAFANRMDFVDDVPGSIHARSMRSLPAARSVARSSLAMSRSPASTGIV